jgi:hypothetical protein
VANVVIIASRTEVIAPATAVAIHIAARAMGGVGSVKGARRCGATISAPRNRVRGLRLRARVAAAIDRTPVLIARVTAAAPAEADGSAQA